MKWLKICSLLVLTLGAMRMGSWAIGWMMARVAPLRIRPIAITSNSAGFGIFALLRIWVGGHPVVESVKACGGTPCREKAWMLRLYYLR
jgi:hypothetical protein